MLLDHVNKRNTSGEGESVYNKFSPEIAWRGTKSEDICQCKYEEFLEQSKENGVKFNMCNFNNAIKISREWCKGNDIESIANTLGVPKSVVSGVYYKASDVAEHFIRSNIKEWQIGGPGVVVIVDTFPEGCANTNPIRMGTPILCISEVKSIPQKYWLETLGTFDSDNEEQIQSIKKHILQAVPSIVLPGSILITPYISRLCSHEDFFCLKSLYPTILSIRDLAKHNNDHQSIFSILATIWKSVLDICEEAQFYSSTHIHQFIINHMWRRRYGESAFEIFLHQLSLMQ